MSNLTEILSKTEFTKEEIVYLLSLEGADKTALFEKSSEVKLRTIGNKVYYRGLVELSNACTKDCLYCGIRNSNENVNRYNITDEEVLEVAKFAWDNKYGSIALQSGELRSPAFTKRISNLLRSIKAMSNGELATNAAGRSKMDRSIRGRKTLMKRDPAGTSERLDRIIRNTYRTLMTRGMKGCYIYCTDPAVAAYLRSRLDRKPA